MTVVTVDQALIKKRTEFISVFLAAQFINCVFNLFVHGRFDGLPFHVAIRCVNHGSSTVRKGLVVDRLARKNRKTVG